MMRTLAVILSIAGLAAAGTVGDKCTNNAGCSGDKVYCKIGSPTCGSGVCSCVPGYEMDSSTGACSRSVALNAACKKGDYCTATNSECSEGSCKCARGYKTGPRGNDCVASTATLTAGGKCYDSIQCYYNLRCRENQCACYDGYVAISGGYECRKRGVGDACTSSNDCSQAPNSECQDGKCACSAGYKATTYMTSNREKSTVCYSTSQALRTEGQYCNSTLTASGEGNLCAQPFVCTTCDSTGQKCGRIVAPLSSAADRSNAVAALVVLLAAAVAL